MNTHGATVNRGEIVSMYAGLNPSSPSWWNEVKVDLNGHCALIG